MSTKKDPLLTIVTVTFNPGNSLNPTVRSIEHQTIFEEIEYLIIDGGSNDETITFLKENSGLIDKWISEKDNGIYDAMNKGLALAKGKWIGFMNAGDRFSDSHAAERLLVPEPKTKWVWGDCLVDSKGNLYPDNAQDTVKNLFKKQTVAHQSIFVQTAHLRELGGFNLDFKVCADYNALCKGITSGDSWEYRAGAVSVIEKLGYSSKQFNIGLHERRQISNKYFPEKRFHFFWYSLLYGFYMNLKFRLKRI